MAERQGKLGDNWNDYSNRLAKLLGWQHVGDKNMDLKGADGEEYGVDSILKYKVAGKEIMQTVLLESKRYAMSSIKATTLFNWIKRLKEKLDGLRNSEELLKEFPELDNCSCTNLGIIMLWVHDADENYLNNQYQNYLENTSFSTGAKSGSYLRVMVLDNRRIVQLCAMYDELKSFDDFNFVYPSGIIDNIAIEQNKVLSVEYMMSKVIIANGRKNDKEISLTFYYGTVTDANMTILMTFLSKYQRIEKDKPLYVYYYDKSDSVIDVINSFENKDSYKGFLRFKKLQHYSINSEPKMIANDE